MGLREEAIRLAKKGFKIIPCKFGEKHGIKNWSKIATTNIDTINKWWKYCSYYNIGILTGENAGGIVIIDCDVKNGIDGISNFYTFLKDNNIELPNTLISTTGSGGKHFYFRTSASIKNSVSSFLEGVDVRGNGGMVIAPPSVHPNGRDYVWENDYDVANLPEKIEKILTTNAKIQEEKIQSKRTIASIREVSHNKNQIEFGERNNVLFRLSSKLVEMGFEKETIINTIELENDLKCKEPLTKKEINLIVNSSCRYYKDREGNNPKIEELLSGKYTTTTIAIYWLIWYMTLYLAQDTIYITQKEMAKRLGIKRTITISRHTKILHKNELIEVKRVPNTKGGFGVNSYKLLY